MKKTITVLFTVGVLVAAVWYADTVTRRPVTHAKQSDKTAVAPPAPELTLKDLRDKDVPLSQFKGKVVLVNFWATWCEPCRVEIPWLIDLQTKYGSKGFTVLGVAMDDEGKKAVAPYVEKERFTVNGRPEPMNYPILLGDDATASKFGGLIGFPTSMMISRDGRVVKRFTGLISYEEVEASIKSLL